MAREGGHSGGPGRGSAEGQVLKLFRLEESPMWETCSVQLNVRLPRDIAAQAEEVQRTDPDFLSRVILYGLTRRAIYNNLREQGQASTSETDQGEASAVS